MTQAPDDSYDTTTEVEDDEVTAPAHDDSSDPYDDPDWDGVQDPGGNPHAVEKVEEEHDEEEGEQEEYAPTVTDTQPLPTPVTDHGTEIVEERGSDA